MNTQLLNENCISVELTEFEMQNYGFTYSELDYKDEKNIFALNSIFVFAKEELKMNDDARRFFQIDVFPSEKNGCLILFSLSKGTEIFKSECIDNFFDCAAVMKNRIDFQNSLYKYKSCYYLLCEKIKESESMTVLEFLDSEKTELSRARLEEFGEKLIEENALEILSGNFFHL